jgi:hypothetical protein
MRGPWLNRLIPCAIALTLVLAAVAVLFPDHPRSVTPQPSRLSLPQPSQSGEPYPLGFRPFIGLHVDAVHTTTTTKLAKVTLSVTNTSRESVDGLKLSLYASSDDKGSNFTNIQIAAIQPDVPLSTGGSQWQVGELSGGATRTYVVSVQTPVSLSK